jgi:hypothetical protein
MKLLPILAGLLLTASALAQDQKKFDVGSFSFERPESWQWIPVNSPMRKAQLKVPGKDGSPAAEITFFHFGPGQGGDVKSNADRWLRQFQSKEGASKIDQQDINGTKVTIVTTEGAFSSGMPGGPTTTMENAALLGAILQSTEGDVFVKMTGPIALVKESQPQFMDFIKKATAGKQ